MDLCAVMLFPVWSVMPPTQIQLIFCGCVYQCGNGQKKHTQPMNEYWLNGDYDVIMCANCPTNTKRNKKPHSTIDTFEFYEWKINFHRINHFHSTRWYTNVFSHAYIPHVFLFFFGNFKGAEKHEANLDEQKLVLSSWKSSMEMKKFKGTQSIENSVTL